MRGADPDVSNESRDGRSAWAESHWLSLGLLMKTNSVVNSRITESLR